MSLRSRLTLGLLTIAVVLIVPLLFATRSLDRLYGETRMLRDGEFAASLLLSRIRETVNDLRASELAVLYVKDERSRATMVAHANTIQRLADSLDSFNLVREARDIRASMALVASGGAAEYAAVVAGRAAEAERISTERVSPAIGRVEATVSAAERSLRERTRVRVEQSATAARHGWSAALIGLVLAVIVVAGIAVPLTRSVHRPVSALERGMRRVADGDFETTLEISPSRTDEFGKLAASFQDMTRHLTELDKLKAEFVSVASHELKTPINVIMGYTQLLQEDLYGPLNPKQRQVTEVLTKQAKALLRLVSQLLDITRFEAGGGKLDVRAVDLPVMLHQLEETFKVLADQRGVRFFVTAHEGLPATVQWDADRMNEVLGNLLANAFKFTQRGGEVELSAMPTDHSVQIEVRDTGAGIATHQLPRVFDKFFQADNQKAASQQGTGLGLAIARTIVEAHHGTIEVESTPGVGTTFTIVMPEHAVGRRTSQGTRVTADIA